jgi:hypothetical protein
MFEDALRCILRRLVSQMGVCCEAGLEGTDLCIGCGCSTQFALLRDC